VKKWGADTFVAPVKSAMARALAAIAGSLVGALGSAAGTWITEKRDQDRGDLLGKQIARREALYSDFLGERAAIAGRCRTAQRYWSLQIVGNLCALRSRTSCAPPQLISRETSGQICDRPKGGVKTKC
jgi:hypothetical protein